VEYNAILDKNNAFIKDNSDKLTQQKLNVGNYAESIQGAFEKMGFFNGKLGEMSRTAIGFVQTGKDFIGKISDINTSVISGAKNVTGFVTAKLNLTQATETAIIATEAEIIANDTNTIATEAVTAATIGFRTSQTAATVATAENIAITEAAIVATEGMAVAEEVATVATGTLDVALGILLAPVTLVVAAIAALIYIFKDFAPIVTPIKAAFAGLSAVFTTIKQDIFDLATGARSLTEIFDNFGESVGNAAKEAYNLVKAEKDLAKAQDINAVAMERSKTQVQDLILQSKDRTKTEKERINLINQAQIVEEKAFKRTNDLNNTAIEIAKKKLFEGKQVSAAEQKILDNDDYAAIRSLKVKKNLGDDELKTYQDLLIKREQLEQEKNQILEKAQNRENQLYDKAEQKRQKDAENSKKAAEKFEQEREKARSMAADLALKEYTAEYDLKKQILEKEKTDYSQISFDETKSFNDRIVARKGFTDKSIELLNLENEKEKEVYTNKYTDDLVKNKALHDKKIISDKEYLTNLNNINTRYIEEKQKSDNEISSKYQDILKSDADFFESIETKKQEIKQKTDSLILDNQINLSKQIADDETKSIVLRQAAFDQFINLSKQKLAIDEASEKANDKSGENLDYITKKYKILNAQLIEMGEKSPIKKLQDETEKWLESFSSDFISKSPLKSLNTFFDGTFTKLLEGAKGTGKEFAVYFNAIAESGQEAFNLINEMGQANFENEKSRLEKQKNIAESYAGDSVAAKTKIENEYQLQLAKIQAKEAKAKQQQAMFNIAIDTAQAVMGAIAASPETFGLPFSAFVLAAGIAQEAMVASQKIPQYWKGGTHGGGLMMVNDGSGSNFQETIMTPDGKIMQPEGRNVLLDAPRGTQIYTHDQWNEKLNEMLGSKGISMRENPQNNTLNYAQMDDIMRRNLGNKTSQHINFDRNGFSSYISRNGNITREAGNRGAGLGIRV